MASTTAAASWKTALNNSSVKGSTRSALERELLSSEFEANVRREFVKADVDGSGALDRTELRSVVRSILEDVGVGADGVEGVKGAVNRLVNAFDTDASGAIEYFEYLALTRFVYASIAVDRVGEVMAVLSTRRRAEALSMLWQDLLAKSGKSKAEKRRIRSRVVESKWRKEQAAAFKRLDTNGDGRMDAKELRTALSIIGKKAGFKPSDESVEMALVEFDADGDASLGVKEFVEMARFIQVAKDIGRKDLIIDAFTRRREAMGMTEAPESKAEPTEAAEVKEGDLEPTPEATPEEGEDASTKADKPEPPATPEPSDDERATALAQLLGRTPEAVKRLYDPATAEADVGLVALVWNLVCAMWSLFVATASYVVAFVLPSRRNKRVAVADVPVEDIPADAAADDSSCTCSLVKTLSCQVLDLVLATIQCSVHAVIGGVASLLRRFLAPELFQLCTQLLDLAKSLVCWGFHFAADTVGLVPYAERAYNAAVGAVSRGKQSPVLRQLGRASQ